MKILAYKAPLILMFFILLESCASKKEHVIQKQPQPAVQEKEQAPPKQEQPTPQQTALEQIQKDKKVEEEKRKFEARKLYETAVSYYNSADFEKAKQLAQEAISKDPYNLDAQKLLAEIDRILSKTTGEWKGITQAQLQEYQVRVEQAEAEIKNLYNKGLTLYNNRQYDEAVRILEETEFKLTTIPFDVPIRNILPQVRGLIDKSKKGEKKQSEIIEKGKLEQAKEELELLAEAERREVKQKIKNLLDMIYLAIDQKKYDKAIILCDEILAVDPHYKAAVELKEDVIAAKHKFLRHEYIAEKVEAWKSLRDQDGKALIPYNDVLKFPSRREWQEISKRSIELLSKEEGVQEDPDTLAINNKLEGIRLTLNFEGVTLDSILDYVRDATGLNIIVEEAVRTEKADAFSKQLTFKVTELPLKEILKLLLEPLELGYAVEQRVLTITKPERALGKPYPELYEVKDILVKIQDFPGPVVRLATPASAARSGVGAAQFQIPEEPKSTGIPGEQLVEVIKANTAEGKWSELGYTMELTTTELLSVNAPISVQNDVKKFLEKLRGYAGLMVQVDAKFISVYDDFVKEMGVDIQPAINIAQITSQHPWDLNFSSFNEFLTPAAPAAGDIIQLGGTFTGFNSSALHINQLGLSASGLTGPVGGFGLQYQLIKGETLQLVLRALSKSEKGTILQQPKITVFNGQRGNITIVDQIAYVQDYQIQSGVLTASYDPVMAVLNVGSVLDVKPVVSNDKKYVKMELRMYQLTLNQLSRRPLFQNTTAFGGNSQDALHIELPNVSYEATESTVQVPDRSTLLVAGFKNILQRKLQAKTPLLGDIPVLNFFFSKKSNTEAKQNEFILITPTIIDMGEEEEKVK